VDRDSRISSVVHPALTRRQLVNRGAQFAGLVSLSGLIAACGDDDDDTGSSEGGGPAKLSGTVTMMNYPGWMGENEVKGFETKYPGVTIKEVEAPESTAARVNEVRRNEGAYDMALAGLQTAGHMDLAGVVEPIDPANIPNLKNIPDFIREDYPFGIPTDCGKVGFGYRSDMVSEKPTGWTDLWSLAEKYSDQIVVIDFDTGVIGTALVYLGYPIETTNTDELEKAKEAILELKPHVRAFLSTDLTRPMLRGEAAFTIAYDYDIAAAQKENDNIVWVAPEEGMHAYMDGWVALKGTEHMDEVEAFMNYHLQPKVYADFINTTQSSYLMPAAEPYIDESIKGNASLAYDEESLRGISWAGFSGAEATEARAKIWEEIKAA
jgi:spermidine/putrescine transport system substrate-binding protein